MTSEGWLRGWLRQYALAVDIALAVVVGAVTVAVPHPDAVAGHAAPRAAMVFAGLACLALVVRRTRPRAALTASVLCTALALVLARGEPVFTFAAVLALYAVAAWTDRRTTMRAFLASTVVLLIATVVLPPSTQLRYFVDTASGLVTANLVAAAVGDAVRSRRAYVAAVEERAVRAEQSREEEARRQVVEERLRIARELHDVVAHHVAVVSVQAGLADHLVLSQPRAAQEALRHVQHASAAILDELAGILSVLRQPDDLDGATPPAPGLEQLRDLVGSYSEAGLSVRLSMAGQPRDLTGTVDLVAYRVVQEALTNAHKHGTDTAKVGVTYTPKTVVLEIVNAVRRPQAESHAPGHGLLGMRERAAAVGGDVQVTDGADGTFRVKVTLPVPAAA